VDRAGLSRPKANAYVEIAGRLIECDRLWHTERLIVELDGYATHAPHTPFEADRARDRALQVAGWRVVRITWRQLHAEPARVARDLRALLVTPG